MDLRTYTGTEEEVRCLKKMSRIWHDEGFWDFDQTLQLLQEKNSLLYYIKDETKDLWKGAVLYSLSLDQADLLYIFVPPEERGQGLGRVLLENSRNDLQGKIAAVFLEVKVANSTARKLYQKLGFVEIGTRKKYYKDGSDALVMSWKI